MKQNFLINSSKYIFLGFLFFINVYPKGGFAESAHGYENFKWYKNTPNIYLFDFQSNLPLIEKNASEKIPTSSLSSLMVTYIVFDLLKQKKIALGDRLVVSTVAWKKGGATSGNSTMFLNPGEAVSVGDLLYGLIVQSGIDAAITLAEGLATSETAFVMLMNEYAKKMHLKNTFFENVTGLSSENHYSTIKNLTLLAQRLILDFPEYYFFFSKKKFKYNNIEQINRNPLLHTQQNNYVDGLKTGFTKEAGYSLLASSIRNGRRLILVLTGLKTIPERAMYGEAILNWGYKNLKNIQLFQPDETVANIVVYKGEKRNVAVSVGQKKYFTLPYNYYLSTKLTVVYTPMKAPIKKGQHIADLHIQTPSIASYSIPLYAQEDIESYGIIQKIFFNLKYFLYNIFSQEITQ